MLLSLRASAQNIEDNLTISAREFFSTYFTAIKTQENTIKIPFALINNPNEYFYSKLDVGEENSISKDYKITERYTSPDNVNHLISKIKNQNISLDKKKRTIIVVKKNDCTYRCEEFLTGILKTYPNDSAINLFIIELKN
ncbi:MAG: hypothetical protein QM581_09430 [Pseudomonas sp.]